jgi:hypothetical protein
MARSPTPHFCARGTVAGMERNVIWYSDDGTFHVLVRFGIRVVNRYREDGLGGDPAETRARAAAKAVELALQYNIELANVRETPAAVD